MPEGSRPCVYVLFVYLPIFFLKRLSRLLRIFRLLRVHSEEFVLPSKIPRFQNRSGVGLSLGLRLGLKVVEQLVGCNLACCCGALGGGATQTVGKTIIGSMARG